jgi:phage-related baseplate assembly protein
MPLQSVINLSNVPAPQVVEALSYETILAQMLAEFQANNPTFTALLESDPAYAILETAAYREMLLRQRVNSAALAVMVQYATGSDLDNLAANFGLVREGTPASATIGSGDAAVAFMAATGGQAGNAITVTFIAANGPFANLAVNVVGTAISVILGSDVNGSPNSTAAQIAAAVNGTAAASALVVASLPGAGTSLGAAAALTTLAGGVDETDQSLQNRVLLAPESYTCAGPKGQYEALAMDVAGVADVMVLGKNDDNTIAAGTVVLVVMGSAANGVLADPDTATDGEEGESPVLAAVRAALSADDVRPLNDTVHVQAAAQVTFAIVAEIYTYAGPDPTTVLANAQAAAQAYVNQRQAVGSSVPLSGIIAALSVAGVQRVVVSSPATDTAVTSYQFPYCTGITLTNGGVAA